MAKPYCKNNQVKLLSAPRDGIIYDPSHFRYGFWFMGHMCGWIDEYVTKLMEEDGLNWKDWMWKRIFGH